MAKSPTKSPGRRAFPRTLPDCARGRSNAGRNSFLHRTLALWERVGRGPAKSGSYFGPRCFSREQLRVASYHGVGVILLWGSLECCWDVRRARQQKNKGTTPSYADYLRKNRPTFEMYEGAEYDEFKAEAFEPSGARPSRDILLTRILERLAKQGIELTASWACVARQSCDDAQRCERSTSSPNR